MVAADSPGPRIAVVDWETAAIGPGVIDLAALVEGQWSPDARMALLDGYLAGRDGRATQSAREETAIDLTCARLHLCLELVALPAAFDPPADQRADWLAKAGRLAEQLPW
jgi:thiamine kinase-like enzyme